MGKTRKTKGLRNYSVLVEFQPATHVNVMAASEADAVDRVDRMVDERKLDFDRESVCHDLLENVVGIRCGDESVTGQTEKVSVDRRDPFRHSLTTKVGANDGFVLDENAEQFANSVVNYPTKTSWTAVKRFTDSLGERFIIYGQFHNDCGLTEHVDDCLERFTMRHWREIADHITYKMLRNAGLPDDDIDAIEWPSPEISVTKTATPSDDCIDLVKFEWETSEEVFNHLEAMSANSDESEETCPNCDAVIIFKPEAGKDILICPECGKAFCACSLCDCQNHGNCDKCETLKICERIYNANEVNP